MAMDWVSRLRQAVDAKGKHSAVALEAGVNPSALSDILRRKTTDPQLQTLINVCRVCNVTVGWVLGEQGFELGDEDYAHIGNLAAWAKKKIDERDERTGGKPIPWIKRKRPAKQKALPAAAHGESEEVRDREIPPEYRQHGADAVFLTRGDSMTDAGIFAGDILFVKRTTNHRAANHRIVVCRLDGAFAVKRLDIHDRVITLRSENGNDPPVVLHEDAERYAQIGIVVGVARDLL